MGDTIISSDDSFNELKLVEHPVEGSYSPAFVTAETPDIINNSIETDEKILTVFIPLGPNPVTGGHVVYVPESSVKDIDISVEEGIQAVVTSGVTLTGSEESQTLQQDMVELKDKLVDNQ